MKRIYTALILGIFLLTLVPALSQTNLGTFKQNTCLDLYQICDDCTYVNLTTVKLPNSTIIDINSAMNKSGVDYTYNYCNTELIGEYFYNNCGDKNGGLACETLYFEVSKTGGERDDVWLTVALLVILMMFNYMVVYKKNKMIGGMTFFLSGVVIMFIEPTLSFGGLIIMISSLGVIILDLLPSTKGVNSGRWIGKGNRR